MDMYGYLKISSFEENSRREGHPVDEYLVKISEGNCNGKKSSQELHKAGK